MCLGFGRIVISEIEAPDVSESGMKWMRCSTKRQCDRALVVPRRHQRVVELELELLAERAHLRDRAHVLLRSEQDLRGLVALHLLDLLTEPAALRRPRTVLRKTLLFARASARAAGFSADLLQSEVALRRLFEHVDLGFGHIVASQIEVPTVLVILV